MTQVIIYFFQGKVSSIFVDWQRRLLYIHIVYIFSIAHWHHWMYDIERTRGQVTSLLLADHLIGRGQQCRIQHDCTMPGICGTSPQRNGVAA